MTPAEIATLRAAVQADAKGLGFAPLLAAAQDQAVADLCNARTGAGAATIALARVSKGDFLLLVATATMFLSSMSAAIQAKWRDALQLITGAPDPITVAEVAPLLALGVADGLISQAQVDALTTRLGSFAEVVLNRPEVLVTAADAALLR